METENIPLYLDWSFWAVIVATAAIILSQLPPVILWFRKARIELEAYSRIHLAHKIGNPNIQLHLIINNVGGRFLRIKGITIRLFRDGKEINTLPAQNYLQTPNDTNTVLFTSFSLKPKEDWAHIVNFLNYFSRQDEKKYRSAESALANDIAEKRKHLKNEEELAEATEELTLPFITMFDEKFIWTPGEYEVSISVYTSIKDANITKRYRFTLFESDSAELSKVREEYKFGDDINWNSGKHPGIVIQLSEA